MIRPGAPLALLVLLVLVVTGAATARAAPPARAVELTYHRAAGAADCPDEEEVRAGVAARLGYEPFDERARPRITATVTRQGRALEARIELRDGAGEAAMERRLSSRSGNCVELASAMELAISIAIDPLSGSHPRPTAAPDPPAPPPVDASPPPPPRTLAATPAPAPRVIVVREWSAPPAPEMRPKLPLVIQASLGAIGAVGAAPALAFGGTLQLAARRGSISLALEGRADLSASAPLRTGDVRTSLLAGALVPCLHHGIVAGCAVVAAGVIRASGNGLVDARQVTSSFAALGARVALDLPLGDVLVLRAHGDLLAPLIETVLRVSDQTVWTSAPISAAVGLGVGAHFP